MAKLKIYRDNTEIIEVSIGNDSIRESYFMGDDRVRVSFSYPEIIDFMPYDYIIHNGKKYSIKGNEMPTRKEFGKRSFEYDIVFKAPEYRMHDMPLSHLGESKFDYFGTPSTILQLVLDCMSVIDDGFELEIDVPVDIEPLNIYFDNLTCRQAVTQACELFGLEYNFDGHVLYVGKSIGNRLESFTFSQGKGKGLYTLTEVSVPDSPFATRFYGFGGNENLPLDYKQGRKNLVMTGDYVERNINLYGLIVQNIYFDDIYPTRTGTLTAVSSDFLTLTDTSIDFDLNEQQIEEAKIVFVTGELGGQEFEIASYNHSTKAIRINRKEESENYLLPNEAYSPKVGDKYKLVGIIMPESYIPAAENKVAEKTIEYAEKHSHPSVGFELELDELELRRRGLVGVLNVGTWIHVVSEKLNVDRYLRITELSYPIANPSKLTAKISDVVSYTLAERILKDVSGSKKEIATIEREQKRDFSILSRKSAEQARLQAERLNELREYIFDADNYFDSTKIKPLSIETGMLSVGAKSQNFYLSGVTMQPNYLGDPNRFYVSAGQLQHREISIDAGYIWNLSAQAFYGLEPNKTYYLSAKCSKTTLTGTYSLTDTPYTVESQAGFYHFNIGVLYPIGADGNRFFANTSGVSYVVGSQITTGRVKSLDGNTWFDLDTGEIRGKIKFTSGQTVESAIEQAKGEAVAQSGVATQQAIAALSVGGRNLLKKSELISSLDYYVWSYSSGASVINTPDGLKLVSTVENTSSGEKGLAIQVGSSILNFPELKNTELVLSFEAKSNVALNIYADVYSYQGYTFDSRNGTVSSNEWQKMWVKFKTHDVNYSDFYFYLFTQDAVAPNDELIIRKVKLEKGNKVTDWTPAPEDLQQQIVDTDNARKVYIDAQDNLKEVEVKAYADSKVSAEEARAIADATAKANAAKAYADAQDLLLKAQTDAYADGKVTAEEQARISQAQANLQAAKDYAEAQDGLSKIETKAYADGIVDAEEARAIADAQAKLNEAKNHADAQANQAQINAIAASNQNISNAIAALSVGGRNLIPYTKDFSFDMDWNNSILQVESITIPDGSVNKTLFVVYNGNLSNYFRISNVVKEPNTQYTFSCWIGRQGYGNVFYRIGYGDSVYKDIPVSDWQKFEITFTSYSDVSIYDFIQFTSLLDTPNGVWIYQPKLEKGSKATDWTPAPEDFEKQIIDTDNARKAYIDAQDDLKETQTKAYADGKVDAAEQRAIADATAKANAAKAYAEAQDILLKVQTDAYADGKVSAEESARITQATNNLNAAKAYAEAQDSLSKIETKAYADGIVSAEEARAIQDAQNKLNEAKSHAEAQASQAQANAITESNSNIQNAIAALSFGGRNLIRNSNGGLSHFFSYDGAIELFRYSNNVSVAEWGVTDANRISFSGGSANFADLVCLNSYGGGQSGEFYSLSGHFKNNTEIPIVIHSNQGGFFYTLQPLESKWVKFEGIPSNGYGVIQHQIRRTQANQVIDFTWYGLKLEKGNKSTDWTPAPEDVEQQIIDTDNARKAYVDAQDNLKETQTKAYADGKVSAEEARAIADATAKANAAKVYADAQDLLLKAQTDAYADGKVSAEESARITQATNNLNAAKAYAEAQDNLSKAETKAYADGIVDAEEARAIADAQSKLNEAKNHAEAQASQAQVNAIAASDANINNALNTLTVGGRNLLKKSEFISLADYYAWSYNANGTIFNVPDGLKLVSVAGNTSSEEKGLAIQVGSSMLNFEDFKNSELVLSFEIKSNAALNMYANIFSYQGYLFYNRNNITSSDKWQKVWVRFKTHDVTYTDFYFYLFTTDVIAPNNEFTIRRVKLEKGNKTTDWTPAPEDLQQMVIDTDNARKSYIDAQDNLKEVQTKAYADGIVSAEEARAIADATAKANAAKSYADNLKVQTDNYVNSITTPIKNRVDDWTYADSTEFDGNKIRTGTVTADKIDTLNLVARHIATSNNVDKLTINANNDNSIKIRHSNGQVGIQMGLIGGVPKLVFFNEYGNKVWEGGMSGIVYVDNVPESWSPTIFKLLPGNHSNVVPDVNGNITSSEKAQLKNWINTSSGFLTTDFGGAPVISSGTTFYSYSAGINAQAENNRVYEGLHTSQIKSTGNWMPNGWYGQSGTALFLVSDYPVQVYATTLEYYANGKMIASILIDDITML